MNKKSVFVFAVALCTFLCSATNILALNNGLARTPPMGFNTWNYFNCQGGGGHGRVNEALIKAIADAFVSQGLTAVGYQYVNIDDCWAEASRNTYGGMVASHTDFPNGMKTVADYCHTKGVKLGIYSDVAAQTCAKTMPGMSGHENQDADTFVAWGVDYIKVDWCQGTGGQSLSSYVKVRNALTQAVTAMKPTVPTAHPVVFSLCNWGQDNAWTWADSVGNLWRTTGDITNQWGSMLGNMDQNQSHYAYSRIGSWNDPDMMEVGIGNFTNAAMSRSHFSLWCMMAAPLVTGTDVRSPNLDATTKSILTNADAIAVDQDTLGGDNTMGIIQGRKVVTGNSEVWVKLLKGKTKSEYAMLFFNRANTAAASMSVTTTQIASVGGDIATGKVYGVRDLWAHTNLANWTAGGTYTTPSAVPVNDVFMIRLTLPTDVLPPLASVKVSDLRVQPEGEQVIVQAAARSGPFSISLVNAKGAVMYSKNETGPLCSIPTRGLSRGLYFINVQTAKEQFAQKIILK
jgi:alpha-galactosidase